MTGKAANRAQYQGRALWLAIIYRFIRFHRVLKSFIKGFIGFYNGLHIYRLYKRFLLWFLEGFKKVFVKGLIGAVV